MVSTRAQYLSQDSSGPHHRLQVQQLPLDNVHLLRLDLLELQYSVEEHIEGAQGDT